MMRKRLYSAVADGRAPASCAHGDGQQQADPAVKQKNHIVTVN
jgi:hypothetical protein